MEAIGKQEMSKNHLALISINLNGLKAPKNGKRYHQLKKLNLGIKCIQEAHIKKRDLKYLEMPKLGKLFTASDNKEKKRGVATFVKEDQKPKPISA